MDGGLLSLSWWQIIFAALLLTHVTIAGVTIFYTVPDPSRPGPASIASPFLRVWLVVDHGMLTRNGSDTSQASRPSAKPR